MGQSQVLYAALELTSANHKTKLLKTDRQTDCLSTQTFSKAQIYNKVIPLSRLEEKRDKNPEPASPGYCTGPYGSRSSTEARYGGHVAISVFMKESQEDLKSEGSLDLTHNKTL